MNRALAQGGGMCRAIAAHGVMSLALAHVVTLTDACLVSAALGGRVPADATIVARTDRGRMSLANARVVAVSRRVGPVLGVAAALIVAAADPTIMGPDAVVAPSGRVRLRPAVARVRLMRAPPLMAVNRIVGTVSVMARTHPVRRPLGVTEVRRMAGDDVAGRRQGNKIDGIDPQHARGRGPWRRRRQARLVNGDVACERGVIAHQLRIVQAAAGVENRIQIDKVGSLQRRT